MARLVWFCLALAAAAAQDYPSSTPPSTPETPSGDEEVGPDGKTRKEVAGQYIYCAEDNCYELLGVKPTSSPIVIKRSYRRLATEWHPDKNPHPKAKEIFQKYANAYEVLSNSEMRKSYDYLLAHPYEFPMHYLRFSSGKYAPKSDVRFVVFLVVLAVSVVQYLIQGQRRANVIQTLKSKRQFQERLKVLTAEIASANSSTKTVAKPRSGSGKEATSSKAKTNSKKKSENDEAAKAAEAKLLAELDPDLPPVPDLKHTLAFQLFTLPLTGSYWFKDTSDWVLKFRIMGKEYGPEERALLTRLALNLKPHEWERLSEEEKEEYLGLELWVKANKAAYDEEIASSQDSESTRRSAKERRAIRQKKKPTDSVPMMD